MSNVIQVSRISKSYRIGRLAGVRKSLIKRLVSPFQYLIDSLRTPSGEELLWALRDVSFETQQGEVVGIIGRNGAGKSTLLKILSRITEPTSGKALVRGRVGSMLEVGTGFHPELTGRENIFLNGAILGMKRNEIIRKFDEIVEFSEIGKFLDTPVKRYSSGMYVRLAFSVAAHLEPEILLIDEVLAVGDISFQQKCLNRIRQLTSSGMTIFLVSHNMAVIQSSCTKVLYLENGSLVCIGRPQDSITAYRISIQKKIEAQAFTGESRDGLADGGETDIKILSLEMFGEDNVSKRDFLFGEKIRIKISLEAKRRIEFPMINFGIRRGDGVVVCNFNNWYDHFEIDYIEGNCVLEGWLPPLRLVPDFYEANVLVWHRGGNHVEGELTHSKPLAWSVFGDFNIDGIGLNAEDGIIQIPAQKWHFVCDNFNITYTNINDRNIFSAFENL